MASRVLYWAMGSLDVLLICGLLLAWIMEPDEIMVYLLGPGQAAVLL